ncbi:MAG: hypothetical protein JSW50_15980, partial [Candidatus Latescibacterota bacterium]
NQVVFKGFADHIALVTVDLSYSGPLPRVNRRTGGMNALVRGARQSSGILKRRSMAEPYALH